VFKIHGCRIFLPPGTEFAHTRGKQTPAPLGDTIDNWQRMDSDSTDKAKRKSSNSNSGKAVVEANGNRLTEVEFFLSTEDGSVSGIKKGESPREEKKGDASKDQSIRFFLPETF
jgi:hypothetical protein